jgi:hypothetical protein
MLGLLEGLHLGAMITQRNGYAGAKVSWVMDGGMVMASFHGHFGHVMKHPNIEPPGGLGHVQCSGQDCLPTLCVMF